MEDIWIQNGVLEDPRPYAEIGKDHKHEELFGGLPVVWTEKPQSTWKTFTPRDQANSYSCVKQSSAVAMETFLREVISAGTYKLRKNAPDGGMYLQNCGDLDYNTGTAIESMLRSQKMNDPEMDAIELPAKFDIKITGYRTFYKLNIDKVAEAIQSYGNCILVFNSNVQEWRLTPRYEEGSMTSFGHAICAIDFTLINGEKTLICSDSSGKWSSPTGLRLITEDFLNKRGKSGMYYLGIKKVATDPQIAPAVWAQLMAFIAAWKTLYGNIIKGLTK